jgi:CRISPR/Cas system-associated exonuclease Cas4 (RecB family)
MQPVSPDFLLTLLTQGAYQIIDTPKTDPDDFCRFRGANTPCYVNGNFCGDSSSHCPRQAILRKRGIELKPTIKSLLSFKTGRAWEELVKEFIDAASYTGLSYLEEEAALVSYLSSINKNQVAYTARPDLLISYNIIKFPVEIKSVQSETVGKDALMSGKPKLGAAIQLNSAMLYHECDVGFTLYGLLNWLSGYDYATKSRFKLEPSFATHCFVREDDGVLALNNKKTLASVSSLVDGLAVLEAFDSEGKMPPKRPNSVDLFGNKARWGLCDYCEYGVICNQYSDSEDIEIEDFIDRVKMEVNVYVK